MSKIAKMWLRNVVKCGKYSLAKSANFAYFCIACGNLGRKVKKVWPLENKIGSYRTYNVVNRLSS